MQLLRGKFGLAPVNNPQAVLDIGTGTGIWAIEFGGILFLLPVYR